MSSKRALRATMTTLVRALTPEQREASSARTRETLLAHPNLRARGLVLLYLADDREPSVDALVGELLERGQRIALPRMDWDARMIVPVEIATPALVTEVRRHGIREPIEGPVAGFDEIGCVVVPGVAFDARGGRLGRGAGFYDRFLARLSPSARTIGVGFACQGVERVPTEEHDRMLDEVLLDGRSIIR
ncbi:MAG: 5-formyltetrahydrofolate cyclo-ligase [Planctomycetota bacterium]